MDRRWIALAALLTIQQAASATPPHMPRAREAISANHKFVVAVNPHKKLLTINPGDDGAAPLWEFLYDVQFDTFLISNDGETVVTLLAERAPVTPDTVALRFWTKAGEMKSYRIDELLKKPASVGRVRFAGTIGWNHFQNWFDEAQIVKDELQVVTLEGTCLDFSLKNGDLLRERHPLMGGWSLCEKFSFILIAIAGLFVIAVLAGVLTAVLSRRRGGRGNEEKNGDASRFLRQ